MTAVIDRPLATPRAERTPHSPRVAAIIVTWNRKALVSAVVDALTRQSIGAGVLDLVVVDNDSTDGTLEHLVSLWNPDAVVQNRTRLAHVPAFERGQNRTGTNLGGFRSLTIVRNAENLGGCGGFNTGFEYISHALDTERHRRTGTAPDYVWLVDDDIDVAPDTLERLVATMRSDDRIGLVGSRTMDYNNREETIETTIYFDPRTGFMADHPAPGHRLFASHAAWVSRVGGPKGRHAFSGVRDVDIVSACSMLARWSAVREIGFWDYRYFIYCDDADWCLRFARAGYRIVCDLDAVIFHTPWHHKLTPARLYYAQRNILWVIQKVLGPEHSRRVLADRVRGLMRDAWYAATHRRLFHAEIIRRSVDDATTGRWGKLDDQGPQTESIGDAFARLSLFRADARVAVLCSASDSLSLSASLRSAVASAGEVQPRWIEIVRNDVPGHDSPAPEGVERIVYSGRRRSKLRRQVAIVVNPPEAVVVFDQSNDFPLLTGGHNLHVDRKTPTRVQVEEDGLGPRLDFLTKWVTTRFRARAWCRRAMPPIHDSRPVADMEPAHA